jgi:hypothetical protein
MTGIGWLLLIYTVPTQPSRLRAAIWRDLKKAGAVYLRDGVGVLPSRPDTTAIFREIADRIVEFGGEATLVEDARLPIERAATIVEQARTARAEEYAEIARDAEGFLEHVAREREHRVFTFAEVEELEADLTKLRRWATQIRARDHFEAGAAGRLDELLDRGEEALAAFAEETFDHETRTRDEDRP